MIYINGGKREFIAASNNSTISVGEPDTENAILSSDGSFITGVSQNLLAAGNSSSEINSGSHSVCLGIHSKVGHNRVFMWNSTTSNLNSAFDNQIIFASEGSAGDDIYAFYTNGAFSAGVFMEPGDSSWSSVSTRTKKDNIQSIRDEELLNRLAAVPLYTYTPLGETVEDRGLRLGAMAEEWHSPEAFGFLGGIDGKRGNHGINNAEMAAAAIGGIRACERKLREVELERQAFKDRLQALEEKVFG